MRKLMWFTIGFALASLLCGYWLCGNAGLLAFAVSGLLLGALLPVMGRWKHLRLMVAVLLGAMVGFGWITGYGLVVYPPVQAADGQRMEISVTILDVPEETNYGCRVQGLTELDGKAYKLMLYLYGEQQKPAIGDVLTGDFLLRSCLSGGSRDNSYYRGNGILFMATSGKNILISTPESPVWYCYPALARQEITRMMDSLFPGDVLAFVQALLLGDTGLLDYETDTALKLSGIRHVAAVSGLHVTILFSLVYVLTGRRKLLVALLGIPALVLFAALAGFTPSITRACIMHGIMVLAMLVDREYDGPTALSLAVLIMLLNPAAALSVSFQLSVSCMAGIFLFAERIRDWLQMKKRLGKYKYKRLTNWFSSSVGVSIGSAIVTTPLCALYFETISLVSIVTNLLTLWIITYVFYGIMAACAADFLWQGLGAAIAGIIAWGIRFVLGTAKVLAELPLTAVYTESIYIVLWLLLCYGLLAAYMTLRRKRPVFLTLCGVVGLCVAMLFSWVEPLLDDCRITMLDVGQGQCILLQSEGRNYLVDCGGDSDTSSADAAARLLLSQGITTLDGIILTHYDRDHAGGIENLLSRIPTKALYLPETADDGSISDSLRCCSVAQVVAADELLELTYGKVKITLIPSRNGMLDNESGMCVLFQRENCDILITGDRSAAGERELLESIDLPKLEVLVVGHHGSKHSTSRELLEATMPDYAFISVGQGNSFGHPAPDIIKILEEFGCIICRTDENGTVVYRG